MNSNVKGISFSRNFGKEAAIFAGLNAVNSKAECAVIIDCDLQHPPELIPRMYDLWKEGYKVVEGVKSNRGKEPLLYKLFSKLFYIIIGKLIEVKMKDSSDFKLLDISVVKELIQFTERNMFFRGLSSWVGYKSVDLEYEVQPRKYGKTKWSTKGLIRYAITNITSFSAVPLQLITLIGLIFLLFALILGILTIIHFALGTALGGFTTVILLLIIIGGVIMISLGIIGVYIAKIYDEVKNRPRYIISKTAG